MIMLVLKAKFNNSGVILIVTIWILIILTVLAVGVGHRNTIGVKLNRYAIDRLKSYYLAKAGVQAALRELIKDNMNSQTKNYDTLYQCGISLADGQIPEDIFKDKPLGEGSYSIKYDREIGGKSQKVYGLMDEERKININAINAQNQIVLEKLLELLDVDGETAKTIASSVVDWQDSDSDLTNGEFGAEDSHYMGLEKPYHCKNAKFESLNELLLVRGVTKDLFLKIKDYLTIFNFAYVDLKVNVNTADKIVLLAIARAGADLDGSPPTTQEEADSMVDKIVDYRAGDDKIELTADDRKIELQNPGELNLFGAEESLFVYLKDTFFIVKSDIFKAHINGLYQDKKVASDLEVVLSLGSQYPILYWHEE